LANLALLLIGPSVLVVVVVVYLAALRTRYHYASTMTCPKCHRSFDYDWVPGASFTAFRLGRSRYMQCLLCHEWSTFDVLSTRKRDSGEGPSQAG